MLYLQICVSDWHEIWQAAAASNRDFVDGLVWWQNNSKMADGRHFENRYIGISQWKIIGFSWNFVHSSRFWTGLTSRDQKWKSWIGQTPSSTERISCFFDRVQKYRKIRQAGMYKYDSAKMSWMHSCHSQSFRQVWYKSAVDCMRNANKCPKIPYSTMVKKIKKWSGIHTWIWITTKS